VTLPSSRPLPAEQREQIIQFVGYTAVSGAALCVDFLAYWSFLTVAKFAFVAAIGGYVCGVLLHYALSSRVVFANHFRSRGLMQEAPTIARFFVAGATGLVVTAIIVGLLADVGGMNPLAAKIVASACSFVTVFFTLRVFVFNRPALEPSPAV
jgi:putative flippase GtrA